MGVFRFKPVNTNMIQLHALFLIHLFQLSFGRVFRRIRKIAKSGYYLHVRPSVRMEKLGSHWTDLDEI
jgi:hypothetical protein